MQVELIASFGVLAFVGLMACVGPAIRTGGPASCTHLYDEYQRLRYFGALDGLRAISVLAVIWCHVGGHSGISLLDQGNKGVDLFFAISGFLVTTLLLREQRDHGSISLRNFYIRRTLRIFPLYYAVLALYCLLVLLTLRGTPKAAEFWDHLPAFLTYTSNWFVSPHDPAGQGVTFFFAWSLATEEQFYLFWPALMLLVCWLTRRSWAPAGAAVLLLTVQVVAAGQARPGFLVTVIGSLAPAILFGAMFAVLLHDRRSFSLLHPALGHRLATPVVLGALLACLQFEGPGILARFLMALLVACLCIRQDTALHPVLGWKPAVFLGGISYGMYLMHMLAANVARQLLHQASGVGVFVVTTLLVTLAAFLSFRYFETPILRLKGRFQGPTRDTRAVGDTSALIGPPPEGRTP